MSKGALVMKRLAIAILAAVLAAPVRGQQPPPVDPSEVINTLLAGLMGFRDLTGSELQKEVAEAGGVAFRSEVPLDYMTREEMRRYLKELVDTEYPEAKARADQRTLVAFDLLPPGTDLRALRARLLEENVAGFYDERPGKKRLYAVSEERKLTPANQLVLCHELRHALQDQYADVHGTLPDSVGDFDDRRLAFLGLLEGDATLVMERFLLRRLPGGEESGLSLDGLSLPAPPVPGAPAVLRDQLVLPYILGRDFARAVWKHGGWEALRSAWTQPPDSTEQVLHPEKFLSRERPREVDFSYAPAGGRLLNEGVLGEIFVRTLLGEGASASAAAGWGGDRFRVWEVSGRTLLVWRSVWDSPEDAREFLEAARERFQRERTSGPSRQGFATFEGGGWRFALGERGGGIVFVSSDDQALWESALPRQ